MSRDHLSQWRRLLVELVELGEVLCKAVETADPLTAIAVMARMRRVRAELARVEVTTAPTDNPRELIAIREVSALAVQARQAEAMMDVWLARPLPPDTELIATPLGAAAIADAMLPAVWDYDNELVVLVGPGLEGVAEILRDLGQRRIVILRGGKVDGTIQVETNEELVRAVRTMTPCTPNRVAVRTTCESLRDDAESAAKQCFDTLADLRILRNTVENFSTTWLEQGTANLPSIASWPSIQALDDKFAGKPMVIVAPGPSLATNAHLLASLRGKAIICCLSRALKPVLAAGVTPDLIITVDPQDLRYHFTGTDVSRSCLVNTVTVHPSLFGLASKALTMSANGSIESWMFGGVGENAASSAAAARSRRPRSRLARRWKCDPIVVVGLDLSFPNGNYYVAGSSDSGARAVVENGVLLVQGYSDEFRKMKEGGGPAVNSERAVELPGWHGGTVASGFMLSMFHRWFVERMRGVTDTRVYNCTEGGAFIDGMVHRPLADVIPELADGFDPMIEIDAAIAAIDRTDRKNRLADHIGDLVRGLRRCRRLAEHARAVARRDPDKLADIERQLIVALRPLWFASLLAQREIGRAHDVARRDGDAAGYLAASIALFDAIVTVVGQVEPTLAKALDIMRPRRSPQRRSHRGSHDRP